MHTNSSEAGKTLIDIGDLQLRQYEDGSLLVRKKMNNGVIFNLAEIKYGESRKLFIANVEITVNNKKV